MTRVRFSELLQAWEFAASGASDGVQAFVSLERGTLHLVADGLDVWEAPPDDLETGPYLALPDRAELDLGRQLALDFTEAQLPGQLSRVQGFFRARGAYGRFKRLLDDCGQLEAWHAHEQAAKEARLRAWCAAQGIGLT